jgi:hypothetical protein
MPTDSTPEGQFVGSSIEELLVALATGLREAQAALNSGPLTDANGRPLATYHLPYLDFNLQVDVATLVSARGRPIALTFTQRADSSGEPSARSIRSQISGRFVATPPGDGLPVVQLRLSASAPKSGKAEISVEASNSAGEVLRDQPIEMNIDWATSKRLSASVGNTTATPPPTLNLDKAIAVTDDAGKARVNLMVPTTLAGKLLVAVTAGVGSVVRTVVVPVQAGS